jgi:hypothetical protein
LTSVTIGTGVTIIWSSAFRGCFSLTRVTIHATTPPTLGSQAFNNNPLEPPQIFVPADSVVAYRSAWWPVFDSSRIFAIP